MANLPALREDSRKKSRSNAKSTGLIADEALIIKYLREPRRRCKCDASRDVAGEFERVAILGLHRRRAQRQRGIPARGGYFLHGHDTRSTFIMERTIGLDFGARMARYLGSDAVGSISGLDRCEARTGPHP
jgi:hypothetical protein